VTRRFPGLNSGMLCSRLSLFTKTRAFALSDCDTRVHEIPSSVAMIPVKAFALSLSGKCSTHILQTASQPRSSSCPKCVRPIALNSSRVTGPKFTIWESGVARAISFDVICETVFRRFRMRPPTKGICLVLFILMTAVKFLAVVFCSY
jgi:hypothetical protein